jgi:hypothetical protein
MDNLFFYNNTIENLNNYIDENEIIQIQSTPHINNFYSLSKNSKERRIKQFENYLFGERNREYKIDLDLFKKNKCQKIKKKFGKFFTETIIKLYKNRLLTIIRIKSGYKHLLLLYQYYLNKKKENKDEEFIKCFPSFKKIYLFLKQDKDLLNDKSNFQNLLFIKIYIDLYDNYINLTENSIDFKKKKFFFKITKEFYSKISFINYDEIKWSISTMNLHFYSIKEHKFYLELEENRNIRYFSDKFIKLKNLFGGFNDIEKLFFL